MAPDCKVQGLLHGSLNFLITQFQMLQAVDDHLCMSSWRICFESSLYAAVEINHRGDSVQRKFHHLHLG